jgi:hypothetical protein
MVECPCKDCICYSICRQKDYVELIIDCSLAHDYVIRDEFAEPASPNGRDEVRMAELYKVLKPSRWVVENIKFKESDGLAYNLPFIVWTEEGKKRHDSEKKNKTTGRYAKNGHRKKGP